MDYNTYPPKFGRSLTVLPNGEDYNTPHLLGGTSYSPNVAYLTPWGEGVSGAKSQQTGAGSPLQEARSGGSRSGAVLRALGWQKGVSGRWEAGEEGVESPLQHTVVLRRREQAVQAR